jgi:hypothetical protein
MQHIETYIEETAKFKIGSVLLSPFVHQQRVFLRRASAATRGWERIIYPHLLEVAMEETWAFGTWKVRQSGEKTAI